MSSPTSKLSGTGPATPSAPQFLAASHLVLTGAAAVILVMSVVSFLRSILGPHPMTPFVAPQYWLSYDYGFVRRGLPGEVLHLLSGGRAPSYALVKVAGAGLSATAVAAILVLARQLGRRAGSPRVSLAVAAAVVASPLGLTLYARDLGRTDALGVVLLVALACLPWGRLRTIVVVLAVGGLAALAVATTEFLIVFLLPVALLAVWTALAGHRFRAAWTAVAAIPSLAMAVLCALVTAPLPLLSQATAAARSAGVPPPVPLVPGQVDNDAVARLKYGLLENSQAYYATTTAASVIATTVVYAGLYVVLVVLVWHLLGHSLRDRAFTVLVAMFALSALAVSVAGIDYRRWWALAAVAALAMVLQLTPHRLPPPALHRIGFPAAAVGLAITGILLQDMPVWPLGAAEVAHLTRFLR